MVLKVITQRTELVPNQIRKNIFLIYWIRRDWINRCKVKSKEEYKSPLEIKRLDLKTEQWSPTENINSWKWKFKLKRRMWRTELEKVRRRKRDLSVLVIKFFGNRCLLVHPSSFLLPSVLRPFFRISQSQAIRNGIGIEEMKFPSVTTEWRRSEKTKSGSGKDPWNLIKSTI